MMTGRQNVPLGGHPTLREGHSERHRVISFLFLMSIPRSWPLALTSLKLLVRRDRGVLWVLPILNSSAQSGAWNRSCKGKVSCWNRSCKGKVSCWNINNKFTSVAGAHQKSGSEFRQEPDESRGTSPTGLRWLSYSAYARTYASFQLQTSRVTD